MLTGLHALVGGRGLLQRADAVDHRAPGAALGLADGEELAIVLTFGYPAHERHPERRTAEEWSAGADRKLLDELVSSV